MAHLPGAKRGDAVLVQWQDALTTHVGWKSLDDIATEPADVVTVGILVVENDQAIVVALTAAAEWDDMAHTATISEVNGAIAIPTGWVQDAFLLYRTAV